MDGFRAGTDDYLVKPFAMEELVMRVRSLASRRSGQIRKLQVADLEMDLEQRRVMRSGVELRLTPSGWILLETLMRASPSVVDRKALEYALWRDSPPDSNSLKVHLHNLRQQVNKPFPSPIIHTGFRIKDSCCKRKGLTMPIESRAKTLRRELRLYVISLTVAMAIVYSGLLAFYFEEGLDKAALTIMTMEARVFESHYVENPQTPPPRSATVNGYLEWGQAPAIYQQTFPESMHEPFELIEHDDDNSQEESYYLLYVHELPDGAKLHLIADIDASLFSAQELEDFDDLVDFSLPLGIAYVLAMVLLLYVFNRRISKQSQAMADWAMQLSLDNASNNPPDFQYAEFNSVASQLRNAFERIGKLLARERHFLRNASHELRTPISVSRVNIELLYRLGVPDSIEEPIERIKRANQSMQQLTETLLWLSREEEQPPLNRIVVIDELIESVIEEHRYLLTGKSVKINCSFDRAGELLLPGTPLRIVLANLIRNAFQYTNQGEVSIVQQSGWLIVSNEEDGPATVDKDESFGLGLTLVEQICARLDWSLDINFVTGGVRAAMELPVAEPSGGGLVE